MAREEVFGPFWRRIRCLEGAFDHISHIHPILVLRNINKFTY